MIIFGILLLVIGAVLNYAVDASVQGIDIQTVGVIFMVGGVIALIAGAVRYAGTRTVGNRSMTSERHVSADGQHVVEHTEID